MGNSNKARQAERKWCRAAKEFTIECATARPRRNAAKRIARLWTIVQRQIKVTA